jgi:hypothetical protein
VAVVAVLADGVGGGGGGAEQKITTKRRCLVYYFLFYGVSFYITACNVFFSC